MGKRKRWRGRKRKRELTLRNSSLGGELSLEVSVILIRGGEIA
jgi:hypothetical protein